MKILNRDKETYEHAIITYWQQLLSIGIDKNPFFKDYVDLDIQDYVLSDSLFYFIPNAPEGSHRVIRKKKIQAGKPVLIALNTSLFLTTNGNIEELMIKADVQENGVEEINVKHYNSENLRDIPRDSFNYKKDNLRDIRIKTPSFNVNVPVDSILKHPYFEGHVYGGLEYGEFTAVSDGYWIPIEFEAGSQGVHTVETTVRGIDEVGLMFLTETTTEFIVE